MSFEFLGAWIADGLLRGRGAAREQRDLVVEGIVRHQDLGEVGSQTRVGGLLQLATILDNVGRNAGLLDRGTIEGVVRAWPRLGWSMSFALAAFSLWCLGRGHAMGGGWLGEMVVGASVGLG